MYRTHRVCVAVYLAEWCIFHKCDWTKYNNNFGIKMMTLVMRPATK